MMVNFDHTVFGPIDKYDNIKCSLFRTKINEDDENSDLCGFFRILYITENIWNKKQGYFSHFLRILFVSIIIIYLNLNGKVSEKYSSKKGIWSYCSISKRMYSIYIPFFEPNQNLEQALSRIDYYRFYFVHLLEYYLNKKWYMHYKNEDNYAAHFAYLSAL